MDIYKHLNRNIFHRFNLHLSSFLKSNTLEGLLTSLKLEGLELEIVFDVGAYKGMWSNNLLKYVSPSAKFYLFEPNRSHKSNQERERFKYFNCLLWSKDGEEIPFYSNSSTGDSVYKEVGEIYKNVIPQLVKTRTLDSLIQEHRLPQPDFIKLDTQGAELDILKGSKKALELTKLLVIELPVVVYNEKSPTMSEVLDYLDQANFIPIGITEIHIRKKVLVQVDIAFINNREFELIFNTHNIFNKMR